MKNSSFRMMIYFHASRRKNRMGSADVPHAFALPQHGLQRDVPVAASAVDQVDQRGHGAAAQLLGGLYHGGERRDRVLGDGDAVDGDDGTVLRHAHARVVQRADGGDGHGVRRGEHRGERGAGSNEPSGGVVGAVQGIAGGLGDQRFLRLQARFRQRPLVALEPQRADRAVLPVRQQDRDLFVAAAQQIIGGGKGGRRIVHRDGGVGGVFQRAEAVAVGTAHERDAQQRRIGRGIIALSAEQHQPLQPFAAGQRRPGQQFALIRVDLVQHQRVAQFLGGLFDGADHGGEKNVADPLDHEADGVRRAADQVARRVVRDIVDLLRGLKHLPPYLFAHVRMPVDGARNGADGNAAELCQRFNVQSQTPSVIKSGIKMNGFAGK